MQQYTNTEIQNKYTQTKTKNKQGELNMSADSNTH